MFSNHSFLQNKLELQSKHCVFLGYASNYKGYRCLDPPTGRVHVSRHVLFYEDAFPYPSLQSVVFQSQNISPLQLINVPNPFVLDQHSLSVSLAQPVASLIQSLSQPISPMSSPTSCPTKSPLDGPCSSSPTLPHKQSLLLCLIPLSC